MGLISGALTNSSCGSKFLIQIHDASQRNQWAPSATARFFTRYSRTLAISVIWTAKMVMAGSFRLVIPVSKRSTL